MLRLDIAADLASTDGAAARIRELADRRFPEEKAICVEIAVAEALSNIVLHSCAGLAGRNIQVAVDESDDGLLVSLADSGRPLPKRLLDGWEPRSGSAGGFTDKGRGLALIHECADEVRYTHSRGVNSVTLNFKGRKK